MTLTLESQIILLSNIPILLAIIVFARFITKNRSRPILLFTFAWISLFCLNFCAAIGYSTLNTTYLVIRIFFFVPMGAFLSIGIDFAESEKIYYPKLLILAILTTILFFQSQDPKAFELGVMRNGEETLNHAGIFRITLFLLILYIGLILLVFSFKLFRKSPVSLKKYALLNLIGAICMSLMSSIAVISGLTLYIPGFAEILVGVGILLNTIAFAKQPKLTFVLPFKVKRLIVLHTQTGLAIFQHVWVSSEKDVDANLFTGVYQGVSIVAKQMLDQGNLKEVLLDRGVMIIQPSKDLSIASILVASNPSKSLRTAINNFTDEFSQIVKSENLGNEVFSNNTKAQQIIEEHFPFIPEY